ncbi:hypothetical protein GCM10007852_05580 [Agaribacter marinus]|uniref:Uncharacterized protein n=1 Tax=Agaribacter marinus TaxID=1431249 RepID=A0AA37WJD1_9ALTE|nr:hypothetical protein GCM10007852_05580 [Agaribacter marinus]
MPCYLPLPLQTMINFYPILKKYGLYSNKNLQIISIMAHSRCIIIKTNIDTVLTVENSIYK